MTSLHDNSEAEEHVGEGQVVRGGHHQHHHSSTLLRGFRGKNLDHEGARTGVSR